MDTDSHIEHFRPQSDEAADPLDFSNMLCSCQNKLKKGDPRHCGVLKEDWFDNNLIISPFDSSCETRFAFELDGLIKSMSPDRPGFSCAWRMATGIFSARMTSMKISGAWNISTALSIYQQTQPFISSMTISWKNKQSVLR